MPYFTLFYSLHLLFNALLVTVAYLSCISIYISVKVFYCVNPKLHCKDQILKLSTRGRPRSFIKCWFSFFVFFFLKGNLDSSCGKLNASVLVERLCLKSQLYLGFFETDNAEFTQGGKTCINMWTLFCFLFSLSFMGYSSNSLT